jgi:TPR repeat protein
MSVSAPEAIEDNVHTVCREAPPETPNTDGQRPPPMPVSVEWHRRAAGQGNTASQFLLGVMYFIGDGVSQDDEEAFVWLTLAVKAGHPRAVGMRNILIVRMTGAQIEAGLRRAWQLAARFVC